MSTFFHRHKEYGKEIMPKDCLAVLEAAFKDFMAIMGKLQGPGAVTGDCLTKNERLLVLYYLEAIVMLKLLQQPGVVTDMTVSVFVLLLLFFLLFLVPMPHKCAKLSVCRLRNGRREASKRVVSLLQ